MWNLISDTLDILYQILHVSLVPLLASLESVFFAVVAMEYLLQIGNLSSQIMLSLQELVSIRLVCHSFVLEFLVLPREDHIFFLHPLVLLCKLWHKFLDMFNEFNRFSVLAKVLTLDIPEDCHAIAACEACVELACSETASTYTICILLLLHFTYHFLVLEFLLWWLILLLELW